MPKPSRIVEPAIIEQGSPEWFEIRLGKVTASRIADVIATIQKGAPTAARGHYMAELVAERLTGETQEKFVSGPMMWGTSVEPEARTAYEFYCGMETTQIGFVHHPEIKDAGASPDSLVGIRGLNEIKCPNTSTHITTLLAEQFESRYVYQMQFQMDCTGREWCDFVSFDPRMPEELKLFVHRVYRDDHVIEKLRSATVEFLEEVEATVARLRGLNLTFPEREAA